MFVYKCGDIFPDECHDMAEEAHMSECTIQWIVLKVPVNSFLFVTDAYWRKSNVYFHHQTTITKNNESISKWSTVEFEIEWTRWAWIKPLDEIDYTALHQYFGSDVTSVSFAVQPIP